MANSQALLQKLETRFADQLDSCVDALGEVTIEVSGEHYLDVCSALRDEAEFRFEMLMDLCGVDYGSYGEVEWQTETSSSTGFSRGVDSALFGALDEEDAANDRRFATVLHLLSIVNNQRLRVRVFARPGPFPVVDSVINIWNSADWYERESFDLYGIVYEGHPDLRRILTDYGFIGYPFRKDFPLSGHVEMRYDPDKQRVVYEPVSIEPRVLVPRVVRNDSRYENGEPEGDASDA